MKSAVGNPVLTGESRSIKERLGSGVLVVVVLLVPVVVATAAAGVVLVGPRAALQGVGTPKLEYLNGTSLPLPLAIAGPTLETDDPKLEPDPEVEEA